MKNEPAHIIKNDGIAIYYGCVLNQDLLQKLYHDLLNNINWEHEQIIMFGNNITIKRKVAFYAENSIEYTYSKKTKKGLPWTNSLLQIKKMISAITKNEYNACLLNLYHNGDEGMGWHSDNEKEIITNSSIASLSIGAQRKFAFKHKLTKETHSLILENGSLLEMKGTIQQHWLHCLPKSKKVQTPRINLTFRQMHHEK